MAPPPHSSSLPPLRVNSVAIIGAGISGVCSAAHALREGLSVTVFERSNVPGGVWHYDPRTAEEPDYPNERPSSGDFRLSRRGEFRYPTPPPGLDSRDHQHVLSTRSNIEIAEVQAIRFAPPGPCYAGLRNNVPTSLMHSVLGQWPPEIEDFTSQQDIDAYIRKLARSTKVDEVTHFNTRVDGVAKTPDDTRWEVRTIQLVDLSFVEKTWHFDAVVVATGHYNMPRIPDIPGLKDWKAAFGNRVSHSKGYRKPDSFHAKNVFILGGGVSSTDISRELDSKARKVYQSTRLGKYDLPASLLPENGERVTNVAAFELDVGVCASPLDDNAPVPGKIMLTDGRVIQDVDHIIIATGYITSYPMLQELHSDTVSQDDAGDKLLVTKEGDMTHNLYEDIWYIEDPTLSFVGAPYHVITFSLFDFQSQVVARVLAGKARLPKKEVMRKAYDDKVEARGLGRDFHSLRGDGEEIAYVDRLVGWVNRDAKELGFEPMEGQSDSWRQGYWDFKEAIKKKFEITE